MSEEEDRTELPPGWRWWMDGDGAYAPYSHSAMPEQETIDKATAETIRNAWAEYDKAVGPWRTRAEKAERQLAQARSLLREVAAREQARQYGECWGDGDDRDCPCIPCRIAAHLESEGNDE